MATNVARYTNLTLSLMRDDGAIVYLNGVEVDRSNMPEGPVSFSTLASANASDDGTIFYPTNVAANILREGVNVLAVELHQANVGSSDLSFDLELSGVPVIVATPRHSWQSLIRQTMRRLWVSPPPQFQQMPRTLMAQWSRLTSLWTTLSSGGHKQPLLYFLDRHHPGFHSLQAVATDDQGATGSSAIVAVNAYDAAATPLTQITSPGNGAIFDGPTNLTITAKAASANHDRNVVFVSDRRGHRER